MREKKTDPELPLLLPFIPGQASNGEFVPRARTRQHLEAETLALETSEHIAWKRGIDRRRFSRRRRHRPCKSPTVPVDMT